jgi:uncharacterized protein
MSSSVHGHFVWAELLTADLSAPRSFYAALLGWTVTEMPMEPEPYPIFHAGASGIGGMMRVNSDDVPGGVPNQWLPYVGVTDASATFAAAVARGATAIREPLDIPDVGRLAVLSDPWGANFALLQPAYEGVPPLPAPVGHLAWADMGAGDLDNALAFYQQIFGWTLGETHDMGEMGPYQLVQTGGHDFVGLYRRMEGQPPSSWTLYFRTADVDAAATRCTAAGGQVLMGPHDVPGGSRIIIGVDPVGAVFGLVQSPD